MIDLSDEAVGGHDDDLPKQLSNLGLSSSKLSQINTVTAQSGGRGKDVDEFDMLAQSRTVDPIAATAVKENAGKKIEGKTTGGETVSLMGF